MNILQNIKLNSTNLTKGTQKMSKTIELTAADGHKLDAYIAEPSGKVKGAIIVVQEIFGVNSHIRSVADSYAADGYLAIAPAFFDRLQRNFETGYNPKDIEAGVGSGAARHECGP
jgi:carboxymethylenebutenolidase